MRQSRGRGKLSYGKCGQTRGRGKLEARVPAELWIERILQELKNHITESLIAQKQSSPLK